MMIRRVEDFFFIPEKINISSKFRKYFMDEMKIVFFYQDFERTTGERSRCANMAGLEG